MANGDRRRKGAELQEKGSLTKASRPPEQAIPEAGIFLSVGGAPVKKTLLLLAQKSCKKKQPVSEETSCFLELLTRFELVTSSLPRMRSTD